LGTIDFEGAILRIFAIPINLDNYPMVGVQEPDKPILLAGVPVTIGDSTEGLYLEFIIDQINYGLEIKKVENSNRVILHEPNQLAQYNLNKRNNRERRSTINTRM
jgi:hypothetical protein